MKRLTQSECLPYEFMPITGWGRLPNGAEIVQYDAPMFFSFTEHSLLRQYPNMRAECHWHIDLEFTHIIHGHMWYFVNGEIVRLEEGQAIFVNSRQLHYGFTEDGTDCEFSCTLLNPARMSAPTAVYERFVMPLVTDETMPYVVLSPDDVHGNGLIAQIMRLHDAKFGQLKHATLPAARGMALANDTASLTVLSCFYAILHELTTIAQERGDGTAERIKRHPHVATLAMMVDFVQQHYVHQITLAQIAAAGSVGRTTCAAIFRELLGQTPIEFVNDVRVRAAAELLATTQLPVSAIATQTGFSSSSFFTRTFRRLMHITPLSYRNGMLSSNNMDNS
ncbi:AraC family transcriptional regulator [Bifidobacterium panos]|uniref:Transcriptional regulator, AraC family n=1 Tax=Bifidobacterium panos TaxID=2675321 RepID=A0ABX1SZ76_9BIFI|nr:AraC family transcriptional regulator [Bifidobacterium sp. DSM 109963]NMN02218.1 transcriptional regulator, AraC family [Bifidobacterium sp. DSM 109963]